MDKTLGKCSKRVVERSSWLGRTRPCLNKAMTDSVYCAVHSPDSKAKRDAVVTAKRAAEHARNSIRQSGPTLLAALDAVLSGMEARLRPGCGLVGALRHNCGMSAVKARAIIDLRRKLLKAAKEGV